MASTALAFIQFRGRRFFAKAFVAQKDEWDCIPDVDHVRVEDSLTASATLSAPLMTEFMAVSIAYTQDAKCISVRSDGAPDAASLRSRALEEMRRKGEAHGMHIGASEDRDGGDRRSGGHD